MCDSLQSRYTLPMGSLNVWFLHNTIFDIFIFLLLNKLISYLGLEEKRYTVQSSLLRKVRPTQWFNWHNMITENSNGTEILDWKVFSCLSWLKLHDQANSDHKISLHVLFSVVPYYQTPVTSAALVNRAYIILKESKNRLWTKFPMNNSMIIQNLAGKQIYENKLTIKC